MSERHVDCVVIGAGPAGEVLAGRLADGGLSVVIVEQHLVAGECSFYACMPSKALLRPAELMDEVRRVPGAAEALTGEIDPSAVLARRDQVIHDLDDSAQLPWLEDKRIELIRGHGELDGERRVKIGDEVLIADKAVAIATGTAALMPPIEGLAEAEPWNNRQGTTSKKVPESMIVLGAGPVGSELSQAWSSLGTKVTLIEGGQHILQKEEEFAGDQVADALREIHGVNVMTGSRVNRVKREDGVITATLESGGEVEGAEILVAIGRKPRTDGIGLESIGISPDGFLSTDDQLRVGDTDWLYAVGDVNGRALLTHMGKYQARIASNVILGKDDRAYAESLGSPRVTFTDPQIAAVGMTLKQAKEAGINASATDADTSSTAGASFYGRNTKGTTRLVIDEDRRVIVGATFVGFETADMVQAATVAIVGEVPLEKLAHAVAPFPTRSEIWLRLFDSYGL